MKKKITPREQLATRLVFNEEDALHCFYLQVQAEATWRAVAFSSMDEGHLYFIQIEEKVLFLLDDLQQKGEEIFNLWIESPDSLTSQIGIALFTQDYEALAFPA